MQKSFIFRSAFLFLALALRSYPIFGLDAEHHIGTEGLSHGTVGRKHPQKPPEENPPKDNSPVPPRVPQTVEIQTDILHEFHGGNPQRLKKLCHDHPNACEIVAFRKLADDLISVAMEKRRSSEETKTILSKLLRDPEFPVQFQEALGQWGVPGADRLAIYNDILDAIEPSLKKAGLTMDRPRERTGEPNTIEGWEMHGRQVVPVKVRDTKHSKSYLLYLGERGSLELCPERSIEAIPWIKVKGYAPLLARQKIDEKATFQLEGGGMMGIVGLNSDPVPKGVANAPYLYPKIERELARVFPNASSQIREAMDRGMEVLAGDGEGRSF